LNTSPKSIYRFFATGEAITWGLLISALLSRALGDLIPHAVTIAGSIHGAMFLSYCVVAVLVGLNQRTGATEDPRDKGVIDRLFRWFIARPVILVLLIVLVLPAIFGFLLFLGPPTEWFD